MPQVEYKGPLTRKITIDEAFPNGLRYVPPASDILLRTSGSQWDYQPDPNLQDQLGREIEEYYYHFIRGERDKTYMPTFYFIAGAGTGKSRNAYEFSKTVAKCLDPGDLKTRVEEAWVFHVTLENDTSWKKASEPIPIKAIGIRMLAQLLSHDYSFTDILKKYEAPFPSCVVELLLKGIGVDIKGRLDIWKNYTVILVVDGMQNLIHDDCRGDLQSCLASIENLKYFGPFWISCCTITMTEGIEHMARGGHRKRVYLPVASLSTPTINDQEIFPMNDFLMELLVSDCGGQGGVLESLYDTFRDMIFEERQRDAQQNQNMKISNIVNKSDIENYIKICNLDDLMKKFYDRLTDRYSEFLQSIDAREVQAIARAVIVRTTLHYHQTIPGIDKTPEQVQQHGLVRFTCFNESTCIGYLVVPYVWFWILAQQTTADQEDWIFQDYTSRIPHWQNIKHFLASHRCLKSRAFGDGETIKIGYIHRGALMHWDSEEIQFINRPLTSVTSKHCIHTQTTKTNIAEFKVECKTGTINIRNGHHCVINGTSSEGSDYLAGLTRATGQKFTETGQSKYFQDTTHLDQKLFDEERGKAASSNDFFILYTTKKNCNITPAPWSAIVHGDNWEKYFGPFSGRAYIFAQRGNIEVNDATEAQLQLVGISSQNAKEIKKRKYSDIEDFKAVGRTLGICEEAMEMCIVKSSDSGDVEEDEI